MCAGLVSSLLQEAVGMELHARPSLMGLLSMRAKHWQANGRVSGGAAQGGARAWRGGACLCKIPWPPLREVLLPVGQAADARPLALSGGAQHLEDG